MPVIQHQYSLLTTHLSGKPVLKILNDGKPFFDPWIKKDFFIDQVHGRWIMCALPAIKEFLNSYGQRPANPNWAEINGVILKRIPGFEKDGIWNPKPYVEIGEWHTGSIRPIEGSFKKTNDIDSSFNVNWDHTELSDPIRFGLLKAEAILVLSGKIDKFAVDKG